MSYQRLRLHAQGAMRRAAAPRNELPSVRRKIFQPLTPYAKVASLGEDLPPAPPAELTDADWKRRMLLAQEGFVTEAQKFRTQDRQARIIQIAATLTIPLAAAIWRLILNRSTRID
jgi:hypothetical protein